MTDPLHVAPGIVGFLDAPNHVRIRAIRTERWIGFGRARRVVEHLSALCEYPPSTRPPGLAIYGHSGMGKTMLVEKFRRVHPPAFQSSGGFRTSPVLAISLTSRPTERRVYVQLLMALGVSVNERATLLELEIKAIRLLKDSMVRVLVFDEVHNLLAGSPRANNGSSSNCSVISAMSSRHLWSAWASQMRAMRLPATSNWRVGSTSSSCHAGKVTKSFKKWSPLSSLVGSHQPRPAWQTIRISPSPRRYFRLSFVLSFRSSFQNGGVCSSTTAQCTLSRNSSISGSCRVISTPRVWAQELGCLAVGLSLPLPCPQTAKPSGLGTT